MLVAIYDGVCPKRVAYNVFMSRPGIRRSDRVAVLATLATLAIASVLSVGVLNVAHIPVAAGATKPAEAAVVRASNSQSAIRPMRLPPPAGRFDYQLGGSYPPPQGTEILSRDRTDRPAPGAYNICYINPYQTQPEAISWWRQSYPELLLRNKSGSEVVDPDWPDEILFDISTKAKRSKLATILYQWIDGCARDGFDAVEPDNLDSWTRSFGLLRKTDNVALARLLTQYSHKQGLAIAQKNTTELTSQGRAIGFDFAIVEECQVYKECGVYIKTYGRLVIEIEYTDNGTSAFYASCKARQGQISIILRDRDLSLPGDAGYTLKTC